jgi:hypothetical protein
MITAAEYQAWAEESLEWARNATKESCAAYIQWAEIWLESASRVERLTALIEDRSKEPTPTAEFVWQLPPFHDWPRNHIEMRIRKRRSSVRPRRFDQLAFDFRENLTIAADSKDEARRIAANIAKLPEFRGWLLSMRSNNLPRAAAQM